MEPDLDFVRIRTQEKMFDRGSGKEDLDPKHWQDGYAHLLVGILGLVHGLLEGVPQLLRLLARVLALILHIT